MSLHTRIATVVGIAALLSGIVIAVFPDGARLSNPAFWAWILVAVLASSYALFIPTERREAAVPAKSSAATSPVDEIERQVAALKREITPPTLALLIGAKHALPPEHHGRWVEALNPEWQKPPGEWYARAEILTSNGLLERIGGSEFAISKRGRLFAALAIADPHYSEVADALKSKQAHAHGI